MEKQQFIVFSKKQKRSPINLWSHPRDFYPRPCSQLAVCSVPDNSFITPVCSMDIMGNMKDRNTAGVFTSVVIHRVGHNISSCRTVSAVKAPKVLVVWWKWGTFGACGHITCHRGQGVSQVWAPCPRSDERTGRWCDHWRTCHIRRCCGSLSWSIPWGSDVKGTGLTSKTNRSCKFMLHTWELLLT